jgi:glycosyltransferase involved in cell wall biosynthesis
VLDEYKLARQHYYLIVGRIDPNGKNLYEAVKLYRKLGSRHKGHRLILVGGINDFCRAQADEFLSWIDSQEDLRGNVSYLGYVDERRLVCLYRGARAAIFFSRYEGFGLPMIEAFKVGCPVIYNSRCEVLRDHAEGAGFEIDENDSEDDVGHKVADLYDDAMRAGLVNQMSSVANGYDWAKCAGQFAELIRVMAK